MERLVDRLARYLQGQGPRRRWGLRESGPGPHGDLRRSVGCYILAGSDENDTKRRFERLRERTPEGVLGGIEGAAGSILGGVPQGLHRREAVGEVRGSRLGGAGASTWASRRSSQASARCLSRVRTKKSNWSERRSLRR